MKMIYSANVHSETKPGEKYFVRFFDDGSWSCSCPHHVMRKAVCKHIKKAQEHYKAKFVAKAKPPSQFDPEPEKRKLTIPEIQARLMEMRKAKAQGKKLDSFEQTVQDAFF